MTRFPKPVRLRRLPARYGVVAMPFVLSLLMTCVVSAVTTLRSLGLTRESLALWPSAWGLSWVVAFPILLILLPMVRRIVGLIVESPAR